jgi:hypothetical protein
VSLFSDIGEDKLRLIAFGAERRKLQAGQMLFREDTPPTAPLWWLTAASS